jgi:hypothetical protein
MKRFMRVLVPLVLVLLAGCVVAPVPRLGRQVTYGAAIGPEDVRFIQPHQTTREEVIASFGEPWRYYEDLQVMVYYWETLQGWWIWAFCFPPGGAADAVEITRLRYLFVQLDALDRVERYGFVKPRRGRPTVTVAQEWISQDRQSVFRAPGAASH